MATGQTQASVFISYSRQDQAFVRELMQALSTDGREVWVDWEDIEKGAAWLDRIKTGIENQDTFVFVVSPDSLVSEICNVEIAHAISHNKRIIPLVRRDVIKDRKPLPDIVTAWFGTTWRDLAEQNWAKLNSINFLFCRATDDFATAVADLEQAINTDLDHLKLHTNCIRRALDWQRREKTTGFLIREDELIEAEAWLAKSDAEAKQPPPTPLHREYIAASRTYENQVIRRVRLLRRATAGFLIAGIVLLLIAVFAGITATNANRDADRAADRQNTAELRVVEAQNTLTPIPQTLESLNREIALAQSTGTAIAVALDEQARLATSREWAAEARQLFDEGNFELAALLAIQAVQQNRSPEAVAELIRIADELSTVQIFGDAAYRVSSAAISPDNMHILTGSYNGKAYLWNIQTGALEKILDGPDSSFRQVLFSPDGKYAAGTTRFDPLVFLWEVSTGTLLFTFRHDYEVEHALFSPQGDELLTESGLTASLWDATTGKRLFTLTDENGFASLAFSPDGTIVITGGNDWKARLWDSQDGHPLNTLEGHQGDVDYLAVSPESNLLVTGSEDGTARLWDIQTGTLRHILAGHQSWLSGVAFAPDGKTVLTASGDGMARLWDVQTGDIIQTLIGHTDWINGVAFAPDGKTVLTASSDDNARLWDVQTGQTIQLLRGHLYSVVLVAYSADGQKAVTVSEDNTARLWDLRLSSPIATYTDNPNTVCALQVTPDGNQVFVLRQDGVSLPEAWNLSTYEVTPFLTNAVQLLCNLAVAPDGLTIASGHWQWAAQIWDIASETVLQQFMQNTSGSFSSEDRVDQVAYSADGTRFLTGGYDAMARIWDMQTGQLLQTLSGHQYSITGVAFSPDGAKVVTGSADATARIWDVATGEVIHILTGHQATIVSAAFSPDGRYVLTASADGTARIWAASSGQLLYILNSDLNGIYSAAFAPDGKTLITAGTDGLARVWDTQTGVLVDELAPQLSAITRVAYLPNGTGFVTGSEDGMVALWRLRPLNTTDYACAHVFRDFTPEERAQYGIPDGPTCPQFAAEE
ncbi:MAG: hypothetical protein BroJett018_29420 [Chloroflexota bacterium]|nr:MAG: hypothetical protein BroJett018_29420 [Chloroflexota bacterium]